jgi:hypothetical protein
MTKEPKLPHKLKWGDRTAARVDEVEYLIGIRVVGYTSLKDVIIVEVHESVAHARGFNERRWICIHEEASSGGTLQVYKT